MQGQGKDIYSSLLGDLREPVESNEFRLKLKVAMAAFITGVAVAVIHFFSSSSTGSL